MVESGRVDPSDHVDQAAVGGHLEHEQLYQALRARDADGAEGLARRHVVGTRVEALRSLAAETETT
ncbi:GntR family transcriptional regulator [Rhodococcus opacus]|uniref:GntR family transcriptional regulator n=1 Tax=Rhodococcus opacus TaxID=37919 RepID=A0AAX3Y5D7_RHOOP|nr:FCD domain-containing protein [Rhodococcus opacus]MCZ4588289.1 GntR family transcriptional regulator [Rhodococcus opacus]WLF44413.1 GntR family transcriptional regulator [Rhodococcus opacus]